MSGPGARLSAWRQYTRPAWLCQGPYISAAPCCDFDAAISVARLSDGQATTRRCDGCQRLWHVRLATDEVGEHFAYWRRQERQPT
ncbi:MAG: hypothetical protein ACRDYA_10170 [Egibacteraceae bacterium]